MEKAAMVPVEISTLYSGDGNSKPFSDWKYIHPVDENSFVGIYGTTQKFWKSVSALL